MANTTQSSNILSSAFCAGEQCTRLSFAFVDEKARYVVCTLKLHTISTERSFELRLSHVTTPTLYPDVADKNSHANILDTWFEVEDENLRNLRSNVGLEAGAQ